MDYLDKTNVTPNTRWSDRLTMMEVGKIIYISLLNEFFQKLVSDFKTTVFN